MGLHNLDHYTIDVADLEESKSFYCGLLGLKDGYRPPLSFPGAWLYCENELPTVHLVDIKPGEPPRQTVKSGLLNHISFTCTGAEEIRARLDRSGVSYNVVVLPVVDKTQFFMKDPNGISVELIFPPAETRQSDRDAMAAKQLTSTVTA
jgi:catechol 2,3-dioxygenase-like lactoylglutathione lyase family enzyme